MRTRGLFEGEREDWDVIPRSSLLPLFSRVRGRGILGSSAILASFATIGADAPGEAWGKED
jgi:hypothetical protein